MQDHACVKCGKRLFGEIPFCPHCGENQPSPLSEQEKSKNPYKILQISESAEIEVIEAAYKSLSKKYHPDFDPSQSAEEKMKDINWAYEILSDPQKREKWNRERKSKPEPSIREKDETKLCPYCAKEIEASAIVCKHCGRAVMEEGKSDAEKQEDQPIDTSSYVRASRSSGSELGKVLAVLIVSSIICMVVLFISSQQNNSYQTAPNMTNTKLASNRTQRAKSNRQTYTALASKQISTKRPTKTPSSPDCILWEAVNQSHAGKEICVYGKIVKWTYDQETGEQVIRFTNINDNFLIKYQGYGNYWNVRTGQCIAVIGWIRETHAYFYMNPWELYYLDDSYCN
jgi:curved DNA-binding protein CbpA